MSPSPVFLASLTLTLGLTLAFCVPVRLVLWGLPPLLTLATMGVLRQHRAGWWIWVVGLGWMYGLPQRVPEGPPSGLGLWVQEGRDLVGQGRAFHRLPHPVRLRGLPPAPPGYRVLWAGHVDPVDANAVRLRGVAVDTLPSPGVRARLLRGLLQRIRSQYPRVRDHAVLEALLLAYRGDLDPDLRDRFQRSGLMHLLALSGLHVGFGMGMALLVARMLGLPFPYLFWLPLGLVWMWGALVGFPASFLRALWMMTFWVLALVRPRPFSPWDGWGAALLLSLLIHPRALYTLGFQLSFLATAGILWVLPAFAHARGVWARWGVRPVAVTLAANLAVLPRLWMLQNGVAWVSPLVNVLAVPLTGWILAESVLGLLPYGAPFAYLASRGLDLLSLLLAFSAHRWWVFPRPLNAGEAIGIYVLLGGAGLLWKRTTRKVGN